LNEKENVKSFFAYICDKKWIDLRQTKTKMISDPFYTHIVGYISPAETLRFSDNL